MVQRRVTRRGVGAAARLPDNERKDPAILALARSATITDLAIGRGVSRKFVYAQTQKARVALDDAFLPAGADDVLFELAVTKTWLRQVIVALPLIRHSSYRGVVEFMRDLLGISISLGTVHNELQAATRNAVIVNDAEDLSSVRVGLHDEIFQGKTPVLAGVDAASAYCYLLVAAEHRDADTWGMHLLDATKRGLKPDHTIADWWRISIRDCAITSRCAVIWVGRIWTCYNFLEPPPFHTQSTRGANRTQPAGIIDRRKPSALVDVVGPRRASTPASVIWGGRPASRTRQPADRNPASKPGRSDASVLPKNRRF